MLAKLDFVESNESKNTNSTADSSTGATLFIQAGGPWRRISKFDNLSRAAHPHLDKAGNSVCALEALWMIPTGFRPNVVYLSCTFSTIQHNSAHSSRSEPKARWREPAHLRSETLGNLSPAVQAWRDDFENRDGWTRTGKSRGRVPLDPGFWFRPGVQRAGMTLAEPSLDSRGLRWT